MQKEITALAPSTIRSRSLLPPRGNTPSGSEDPSLLPSPPSNRCGSPSRSTTSPAHPSSTANASKQFKKTISSISYQTASEYLDQELTGIDNSEIISPFTILILVKN